MTRTLLGRVLSYLDINWSNCKIFFIRHKTFFEIAFLLFYIIVQIVFIIAISLPSFKENMKVIISIYTAVLIVTISLERVLMRERYAHIEVRTDIQSKEFEKLKEEYHDMLQRSKEFQRDFKKLKRKI